MLDSMTWASRLSSGRVRSVASAIQVVPAPEAADSDLLHRAGEVRHQREDADGTGDRRRIGNDLVAAHRDPVAARRRHVAHRHHDRLAGLAREIELLADQFGRTRAAAWRIDPHDQRLDVVVLPRALDQLGGRTRTDRALALVAVDDLALRHHDPDRRAGRRAIDIAQVRVHRDLPERLGVIVAARGAALEHQGPEFIAPLQPVDQFLGSARARRCRRRPPAAAAAGR